MFIAAGVPSDLFSRIHLYLFCGEIFLAGILTEQNKDLEVFYSMYSSWQGTILACLAGKHRIKVIHRGVISYYFKLQSNSIHIEMSNIKQSSNLLVRWVLMLQQSTIYFIVCPIWLVSKRCLSRYWKQWGLMPFSLWNLVNIWHLNNFDRRRCNQ